MGLSSQLAPSAIAKPGVCTSTTRPASPYEGQVIYTTDTDLLQIWNGTAWRTLAFATATTGSILQTRSVQGNTQQTTTSSTYADITGLSITIAPTATTSTILLMSTNHLLASGAAADCGIRFLRDSTNIFTSVQFVGAINTGAAVTSMYLDSPATTSSVTYKVQFNRNAGTGTVYSSITNTLSNFVLMEIAA